MVTTKRKRLARRVKVLIRRFVKWYTITNEIAWECQQRSMFGKM